MVTTSSNLTVGVASRAASAEWRWPSLPLAAVRRELCKEGAFLLPLRLFIGLGWLRACTEKLIEPGWHDGSNLAAFLAGHSNSGKVAFPLYNALITDLFLPHVAVLAWIVMLGQLLAGLGVLSGAFTRWALVGGIFMNLNFVLAGEPNPSAFYIVIQVALLHANCGAILGLDAVLPAIMREWTPLATLAPLVETLRGKWTLGGMLGGLVGATYALPHVRDFSPAGSVHDPAMLLVILATLAAFWSLLAWVRSTPTRP
jgi:thiosulfate dehydrogenase (quinone) large subunit